MISLVYRVNTGDLAVPTRGVVFFDIDGTLVLGTSSGAHLAALLGHEDAVIAAESDYNDGLIDNDQVCVIDAQGWAGHRTSQVEEWLLDLPLVTGIAETVEWCQTHGLRPYLASLAWSVVGAHLANRFGFEGHCGPMLEIVDDRFTGHVTKFFDERGKRDFAIATCAQLNVAPDQSAAVGDSRSDLLLFGEVGLSVAFNAEAAARAAATRVIDGASLTDVIPVLEDWLPATDAGRAGATGSLLPATESRPEPSATDSAAPAKGLRP